MSKRILVFAVMFTALLVFSSIAEAGYLVSDSKKECVPASGAIGLSGYTYMETCPEGYTVVIPQKEEVWWQALIRKLLAGYNVEVSPKKVFIISTVVSVVKFILLKLGVVLSGPAALAFTLLISIVESFLAAAKDGVLAGNELAEALIGLINGLLAGTWFKLTTLVQKLKNKADAEA